MPNRRIVYLQKDDLGEENQADSVLRSYDLKKKEYLLKPHDIISLRVASLTDDEYNFIKLYEVNLGIIKKLDQYSEGEGGEGNQRGNNMGVGGVGRSGSSEDISSLALDRMNTGFVLDADGKLDLPQIGEIQLSGLTIPEAEVKVKDSLEGFYETPMVRIQLLNFHFTILGEVKQEGRYTSYDPEMDVFDAISLAGDLTEFADRSNIKIIRREDGQAKVIYINTLDEKTLAANNLYLKRDDLIIVPPLKARTTNEYTLPNVSRALGFVSAALSLTALIISLSNR